MELGFINGPIQNGLFTLSSAPGKGVSLRLAAALNQLIGVRPLPHLWNTVTAAGDQRFREQNAMGDRMAFELDLIKSKYSGMDQFPDREVALDAGPDVSQTALAMIENGLAAGQLDMRELVTPHCQDCDHMVGHGGHPCRRCGSLARRDRSRAHLVAVDAARPLDLSLIHAKHTRHATHLRAVSGNVPDPLIISRTRDFGIDLSPLGLNGLVLDPRAGLHVACVAAAQTAGLNKIVMVTTSAALINIAAYGTGLRKAGPVRLTYGVHGRIPFGALAQAESNADNDATEPSGRTFENWFLPLCAMKDKNGIDERQLDPLRKHFRRSWLAAPSKVTVDESAHIADVVRAGDMDWVRQKDQLSVAIAIARGAVEVD